MNTTTLEGGACQKPFDEHVDFSSIIFAPPDTRNVLCARNDGLCEVLLDGRNKKG